MFNAREKYCCVQPEKKTLCFNKEKIKILRGSNAKTNV